MQTINLIKGHQGAGKTVRLREIATQTHGRYLFACPTIELIAEQEKLLRGRGLDVRSFHSQHRRNNSGQSVYNLLCAAREDADAARRHSIYFITHETLMSYDFAEFTGWHLLIDEAPAAVDGSVIEASVFKDDIMPKLDRVGSSETWSVYRLKERLKFSKVKKDAAASKMVTFLKQAGRANGVVIDDEALKTQDIISWFSLWTPLDVSHWASVHIAASAYERSLGYRMMEFFFPGKFRLNTVPIGGAQRQAQPSISIQYFADGFTGSTHWWVENEGGQKSMVEVSRWLEANEPNLGFWSCNNDIKLFFIHRLGGHHISPMAMGLNDYRHETSCAFIFSNKRKKEDAAKLEAADIGPADLLDARETEVIRQFIMRGAIRNADYDGDYRIYLYERFQAEAVANHLKVNGFTKVNVSAVTLPFTSKVMRKFATGTPYTPQTPAERKHARAKRERIKYTAKIIETQAQRMVDEGAPSHRDLKRSGLSSKKSHLIPEIERRAKEIRNAEGGL